VQAAVRDAETGAQRFITDHDGYLKRIDGIMYGDNPDQGVVRGNSFLHAGLRFAIELPPGWDVTNGPSSVVAKEPGADALMVLQLLQNPVGRTIQDVALRSMEGAGFRALDGGRTTINGLDAFAGTYQGSVERLGRVIARAAHVVHDRSVFLVAGIAPQQAYQRLEPAFTRAINAFRPLTRAEAEGIRPNRIALYTAREGDTWQAIAEHQGMGVVKATTLAIMNGHAVSEQPRPGERLKIVVAG
jgi:predicted Zn-dependent protease